MSTTAPRNAPIKSNRTLRASTWKTSASGPSHLSRLMSTACPARTDGTVPTTASTAGRQVRAARIPFVRAEQSLAARSWSTAPNKSEQGAIRMRAAAVMAKLFVRGVSPSCDGPHAKDRILQCGTGVRALSFGWTKLNLVVVVLNLHDCLAEQMAVGHGSGMGGLRKAGHVCVLAHHLRGSGEHGGAFGPCSLNLNDRTILRVHPQGSLDEIGSLPFGGQGKNKAVPPIQPLARIGLQFHFIVC